MIIGIVLIRFFVLPPTNPVQNPVFLAPNFVQTAYLSPTEYQSMPEQFEAVYKSILEQEKINNLAVYLEVCRQRNKKIEECL